MNDSESPKKAAPGGAEVSGGKTAPAGTAIRNRVLLALLALIVVAGVILVWATSGDDDPPSEEANSGVETSSGPTASSSAGPSSDPAVTPPVETAAGEPIELEPVPLDETAPFGDQVSAELVDLAPVRAEGEGAGEISGPALRVTVRLLNDTGASLSLDAVTVSLYFGQDRTPAPPIADGTVPFVGTLEPGATAEGVYTFTIGEDDRDDVSVTVSHTPGSSIVVFSGPVT